MYSSMSYHKHSVLQIEPASTPEALAVYTPIIMPSLASHPWILTLWLGFVFLFNVV